MGGRPAERGYSYWGYQGQELYGWGQTVLDTGSKKTRMSAECCCGIVTCILSDHMLGEFFPSLD